MPQTAPQVIIQTGELNSKPSTPLEMEEADLDQEQTRRRLILDKIFAIIDRRQSEKVQSLKELLLENKDRLTEAELETIQTKIKGEPTSYVSKNRHVFPREAWQGVMNRQSNLSP